MSRSRDLMTSLTVAGLIALAAVSCSEAPGDPLQVEPGQDRFAVRPDPSVLTFLTCPAPTENTTRTEIGPEGGTISLRGHSVYFPPGALLVPVEVKMTVPASEHVEIDVQVNGMNSYRLARPVLATVSYERCGAGAPGGSFAVWHIDASGRPVEPMGSLDDPASQSVSFVTNHFSRYVLVNN